MKAYYSIIQYCPDLSRLEVVNVGLVLFCPKPVDIQVRISVDFGRVIRFFPRVDCALADSAICSTAYRLRHDGYNSLAELEIFIDTRANSIILTKPRMVKVESMADIDRLFKELVE